MDERGMQGDGQIVEVNDTPFAEVDGITLRLNIRRPEPLPAAPMPAVMYIHGGAWMHGDRTVDRNPFLDGCGFFTISVDYRLSGQATFPAQLHDVKAAIRWLRAHAVEYHVDPARIGVWGHSSGAHLAALLGVTGDLADLEGDVGGAGPSSRVQAVAGISTPTDFSRMGGWHDAPDAPEAQLIGGPVPARPTEARRVSPVTYVQAGMPPFLLIYGDQDEIVPPEQSRLLAERLSAAGEDVTVVEMRGSGHNFDLSDPNLPEANRLVQVFFRERLAADNSGSPLAQ